MTLISSLLSPFAEKLSHTVNSTSRKKVFGFYFSFQSFISLDQPPHSELPSSFLTSTFEKYQGISIPSFTHEVVYGNQPRCFLELGYDSLF